MKILVIHSLQGNNKYILCTIDSKLNAIKFQFCIYFQIGANYLKYLLSNIYNGWRDIVGENTKHIKSVAKMTPVMPDINRLTKN